MNGKVKIIEAIEITHHTGIVWSASFPFPTTDFLEDMGWKVGIRGGPTLRWQGYGMRKEMRRGEPVLSIRFYDRSAPLLPPDFDVKQIIATLESPMP